MGEFLLKKNKFSGSIRPLSKSFLTFQFTQKDDVLQGMIDQMDDYMESCKIGFDEGRKEFSRFMEQKHSEIMECKQRHKDVQRVISELKR